MTNKNIILLVVAVLLFGIGAVGFIGQRDGTSNRVIEEENGRELILTKENNINENNQGGEVIINTPSVEVEENIPIGISPGPRSDIAIPELNRPVVFTENFTSEQKEKIALEIQELSASLKKDSNLFNDWLDLGLLRKAIGDYEGARQAWEYASAIRPQNALSFANLGVLYGYYLANSLKAEENFLEAIDNGPKLVYLYSQTADFYVEVAENVEKAKGILKRGIGENPGEEGLRTQLEAL